jgi:hypothetical protein
MVRITITRVACPPSAVAATFVSLKCAALIAPGPGRGLQEEALYTFPKLFSLLSPLEDVGWVSRLENQVHSFRAHSPVLLTTLASFAILEDLMTGVKLPALYLPCPF